MTVDMSRVTLPMSRGSLRRAREYASLTNVAGNTSDPRKEDKLVINLRAKVANTSYPKSLKCCPMLDCFSREKRLLIKPNVRSTQPKEFLAPKLDRGSYEECYTNENV